MKAFLITEGFLREIVKSATTDEKVKHILQTGVLEKTGGLVEFVFNVFSYYMNAYESAELDNYPLQDGYQIKELFMPIMNKFDDTFDTNIRVVDPLDALYNRSFPGSETAFNSNLMDDIFSNIEDTYGTQEAHNWFSEVLQLLEYVIITLESSFINLTQRDDNTTFKLFFAYSGSSITIFVQ